MAAGDVIVIRENAYGKKANIFDGVDDYVLHDAHAVARVAANDTTGTYSAWIYVDNVATTGCILSAGDNDSGNEYLGIYNLATGKLRVLLRQGGAYQFDVRSPENSLISRKWMHVAVVQNGTRPVLYIDGVLQTMTDSVSTDLTMWYDELANCDKFAIGVLESNNTHTSDFTGAIGKVKYWNKALTAAEVLLDYQGESLSDDGTYLQFNVTMEDDGTTDSGLGADNGTLTGNAHYGGEVSTWSLAVERNSSGHAAEFINSFRDVDKMVSIIKRGD